MGKLNNQAEYFNKQTQLNYNIVEDASYARFLEDAPLLVTYYSQSQIETTTDVGFGNVNSNIGENAKKFNKIENVPMYNVDKANWDMNDDDFGIRASFESSGTMIPDTVIPVPEDYFKVLYHDSTYLFKITNVVLDTIKSNNYYKIDFKFDSPKGDLIEKQVVGNFTCIFDRIGTELKSVLRNDIIDTLEKVQELYNGISDDYISNFYNELSSTLTYTDNIVTYNKTVYEEENKNNNSEESLYPGTCVGAINVTNPIITTPKHDPNDLEHSFHSMQHDKDHAIHRFDETKCYNNTDDHKHCIYHDKMPKVNSNEPNYIDKEYRYYNNSIESELNIYDPYLIEFIIKNDIFYRRHEFKSYTFTHVIRKPKDFVKKYKNSMFNNIFSGKTFSNKYRITRIQELMSYFYLSSEDYYTCELYTNECKDLYQNYYTRFRYNYTGSNILYNTVIEYVRKSKDDCEFLNSFLKDFEDFYCEYNRDCFLFIPIILYIIKSLVNNITIKSIK